MNDELYYDLVIYLAEKRMRPDIDNWRRRILRTAPSHYDVEGTVLYKILKDSTKIVIPKRLLNSTLTLAHQHHLGVTNTTYQLTNTWWPNKHKDIEEFIRRCPTCQKSRPGREKPEAQKSIIRPEPFQHIGIDTMGPLPLTPRGNKYILVVVDYFTKWTEAIAVNSTDAQTTVAFLHKEIICRHGCPDYITSDRGTEFNNQLVEAFTRQYQITHIKTTPYHPQGNGLTERTNQTLKNIILRIIQKEQDWDLALDSALYGIRTMKQDSTQYSPFELVYGRKAQRIKIPTQMTSYDEQEAAHEHATSDLEQLQQIRRNGQALIRQAQDNQQRLQNKKAQATLLQIGQKVLLFRSYLNTTWSGKLQPKWDGPYIISDIKGTTHWLKNLDGTIITTPAHRNRLKLYYEPTQ